MIYTTDGYAPDVVESVLGRALDDVDADWRSTVSKRFTARQNADLNAYLATIGSYVPCVE